MPSLQFGNGLLCALLRLCQKRSVDFGNAFGVLLFFIAGFVPCLLDDALPFRIGMGNDAFGPGFGIQQPLETALGMEIAAAEINRGADDMAEGMRAIAEGRRPQFGKPAEV